MLIEQQRLRFYSSVFIASLGLGMYTYFVPVFAQSFGATYLDLGLIGTVFALATAITPMLAGHVADRMNHAWVFSISLVINTFATYLLIFSHSVTDIVIFRLVGGIGMGAFWPTAETMVTDLGQLDKRVKEMGRYSIAMALGLLVGPLIGGVVIEYLGYFSLFLISSATIGVSLLQVVIWIVPTYPNRQPRRSHKSSGNMLIVSKLWPWYMMLLCYGVVWGLITSIFPGYANSVGISTALIGFLFGVFGMTRIFSYATAYRYLSFGEKRTLIFISIIIFAGMLTLSVVPSFFAFLLGIMLIGGGVGVFFPIMINLISRHFPDERSGAAMGSYETAVNMGETMGPYLTGILASATNIGFSFLMMSVFGCLMVLFTVRGRTYVAGTTF